MPMEHHNNMEYWPSSGSFSHNSHLYDSYDVSSTSSMSASPAMSEFELFPPLFNAPYSPIEESTFNYSMPLTPSDFGSSEDAILYSPRSSIALPVAHQPEQKTHATSGRRRAQNRAAQRAFRERKEKHARDLEQKLAELTDKYQNLETNHAELSAAYDKLQKTLEILTQKEETDGDSRSANTLRKFLTILHSEIKIKAERESKLN